MNWLQLSRGSLEQILTWAESQPWCRSMMECPQDPGWHAEGDVWTHSKRVCDELRADDDWGSLGPDHRAVLTFAALLHDSAKPATTRADAASGRLTSPMHAVRGEQLARGILRELGCDLPTRECIAQLVRYHGRPVFLMERDRPDLEVIRLSWLSNNRLLHLFSLADRRGRDCDGDSRPEENLHFLRMLAEEQGCYDRPFPFANDQARFLFFRHSDPDPQYVPHDAFACTVTLLAGLPGSGKDTWLSHNRPDCPVVSLDAIRREMGVSPTDNQGAVIQAARERCRVLLRAKRSFAFNATNILQSTRQRWIDLFADYHARVELVYLEPPFEVLLRRNRERREHRVPEQVIRDLAAKCQPPAWNECHSVTWVET